MSEILVSKDEAVLTLSINRPAKRNALTRAMYAELAKGLNDAAGDFGIRCVVISSEGDHFTAGNDIKDFMDNPPTDEDSDVGFIRNEDQIEVCQDSNISVDGDSLNLDEDDDSFFFFE